jgi:hypothetical protein
MKISFSHRLLLVSALLAAAASAAAAEPAATKGSPGALVEGLPFPSVTA